MAALKNNPEVQALVAAAVEKATATAKKAALKALKSTAASITGDYDKTGKATIKFFVTEASAAIAAS